MKLSIRSAFYKYKILAALVLLSSCYKGHLYVQQEKVDHNFLASSRIGTPDPRQANPPEGQRLLIAWDFPKSLYQQQLTLVASIRFMNEKEEVHCIPVVRKRGSTALFFSKEQILTYRVQVLTADGSILETWKHHFWTEWLNIGDCTN